MSVMQLKRGSTASAASYTPAAGEPVLDTTLKQLYIGDGVTAGGYRIAAPLSDQGVSFGGASTPALARGVIQAAKTGANTDITSITGSAASLTTTRSISTTGDATWTVNFNGTANATAAITLAASGVGAGTYGSVTVNAKGLVTAGTGVGVGVAAFLATPTSTNLATAVTDETGTGSLVFATSPTLVTPNLGSAKAGAIQRFAFNKAASFTLAANENWIVCNGAGTITVTLPLVSDPTSIGREVMIKTVANQTVVSATSNIVPLAGGATTTAILPATAGKWVTLVSDGSVWIIMQGN